MVRLTDTGKDVLVGQIAFFEELFHQFFVGFRGGFHHFAAILLRLLQVFGGNVAFLDGVAQIVDVNFSLHLYQVDDAVEIRFRTDGQLDGYGGASSGVPSSCGLRGRSPRP